VDPHAATGRARSGGRLKRERMNLPADINMHLNPPVTTATVVHEPAAEPTVERPETELETLRRDNSEKDRRLFKFEQAIKKLQLEKAEMMRQKDAGLKEKESYRKLYEQGKQHHGLLERARDAAAAQKRQGDAANRKAKEPHKPRKTTPGRSKEFKANQKKEKHDDA